LTTRSSAPNCVRTDHTGRQLDRRMPRAKIRCAAVRRPDERGSRAPSTTRRTALSRLDLQRRSGWGRASRMAFCLLTAGAFAGPSAAQAAATARAFSSVALSPNGQQVAWIGPAPSGDGTAVMLVAGGGTGSAAALELPGADANSADEVVWSADSRQLGILASSSGAPAVYLVDAASHAARRLARVAGSFHDIRFSPDGSHIAGLYSSPSEEANGPTQATPRDTGAMDTHIDRQHLALIDVPSGAEHLLSPPELYVYEYDWSPNGKELVLSAATGSGNNNWWVARLEAINAITGALRQIAKPSVQIAQPLWSPDGSQIAF